jgi:anti-sigma regulatory factor (Ser/Thr protein kinase)
MTNVEKRPGLGAAEPAEIELELPAVAASVATMRHRATAFAAAHGANSVLQGDVALAISEAVTNGVKYAYSHLQHDGRIRLSASAQEDWLEFEISDQGDGFREGASSGLGLGLPLIAQMSSDMKIVEGPTGTRIQIRFALK